MIQNSIEVEILKIQGITEQKNLSCHVFLNGKLYDVIAPLTESNKENKLHLPLNTSTSFVIKPLIKSEQSLYFLSFNSNLLTSFPKWLPLFLTPSKISELPNEAKGPKLLISISEGLDNTQTAESELEEDFKVNMNKDSFEEMKIFYEAQIIAKESEISKLQQEIQVLKSKNMDPVNKNIDLVEISLNSYLKRNKIEGLFNKYKGSVYKHGPNFVEISLIDNKLNCRTDID